MISLALNHRQCYCGKAPEHIQTIVPKLLYLDVHALQHIEHVAPKRMYLDVPSLRHMLTCMVSWQVPGQMSYLIMIMFLKYEGGMDIAR